jgi:hypothetical protein
MSSKGSRIIGVRVPPLLEARILETIAKNNRHVRDEEWTLTAWVLDAIKAKLAHQSRADMQRERRRAEKSGRAGRLVKLCEMLNTSAGRIV